MFYACNAEHEPREAAASGSRLLSDRTGCLPLAPCSGWLRRSFLQDPDNYEGEEHSGEACPNDGGRARNPDVTQAWWMTQPFYREPVIAPQPAPPPGEADEV